MKFVWLLTTGTGADGDEWNVESIHSTEKKAKKAKDIYENPRKRLDDSTYTLDAKLEQWEVDQRLREAKE